MTSDPEIVVVWVTGQRLVTVSTTSVATEAVWAGPVTVLTIVVGTTKFTCQQFSIEAAWTQVSKDSQKLTSFDNRRGSIGLCICRASSGYGRFHRAGGSISNDNLANESISQAKEISREYPYISSCGFPSRWTWDSDDTSAASNTASDDHSWRGNTSNPLRCSFFGSCGGDLWEMG